MKRHMDKSKMGASLLIAMSFLVVMALIATFTFRQVAMHTKQIDGYTDIQNTYLGALSGLNASSTEGLAIPALNMEDGFAYDADAGGTVQSQVFDSMVQAYEANDLDYPFDQDGNADVQFGSYRFEIIDPGVFEQDAVVGVARNMYFGEQTVVSTILLGERLDLSGGTPDGDSPWDNAIFGGSGGSGGLINGNVSIHGSVHILGEDLDEIDVAFEVGGGAGIYNNYDGMPSDIEDNLSANTRTIDEDEDGTDDYIGAANGAWDLNGEESLRSKLRVRNGYTYINGSSQIGEDSPDAGSKGNVQGIYVNNKWGGNQTTLEVPNEDRVFSDNGYAADYGDYDGNGNPGFPTFADEVTTNDPSSPTCDEITVTYFDEDDTTSYYHQDITPYVGDVTFEPNVAIDPHEIITGSGSGAGNFYWNSTDAIGSADELPGQGGTGFDTDGYMPTLAEVKAMAPGGTITADYAKLPNIAAAYDCSDPDNPVGPTNNEGDYFIWWNADEALLYVNGRNLIDGDLSIVNGGGQKNVINVRGIGSIMVYDEDDDGDGGDVVVSLDMYSTDFPMSNVLLLMAENDVSIGTTSQRQIMGAFYAQGTIVMNKQNELAGAVVSNFFDMGGQVPSIYQVPMLEVAFTEYELSIKPIGGLGSGGGLGGDESDGDIWFELGVPLTRTD